MTETDDVIFVTPYQVSCHLPTSTASYQVSIEIDGQPVTVSKSRSQPETFASDFLFMTFDSACYVCDRETQRCDLKEEVDGVRYNPSPEQKPQT